MTKFEERFPEAMWDHMLLCAGRLGQVLRPVYVLNKTLTQTQEGQSRSVKEHS